MKGRLIAQSQSHTGLLTSELTNRDQRPINERTFQVEVVRNLVQGRGAAV